MRDTSAYRHSAESRQPYRLLEYGRRLIGRKAESACALGTGCVRASRSMSPGMVMRGFHYLVVCALVLAWSSAMAIDEPRFAVVSAHDDFEVRRYEPYVVAETVVVAAAEEAGNQGFRILAEYIFGANKGSRKIEMTAPVAQTSTRIAMTAPVAQSARPDGYVVQFAMPREWSLETLPEPIDSRVVLRTMPGRTLAVIGYSGTWSQSRYLEHLGKLQDALARAGLSSRGEPIWARYDPPWKPWFLRRNEIWLELE